MKIIIILIFTLFIFNACNSQSASDATFVAKECGVLEINQANFDGIHLTGNNICTSGTCTSYNLDLNIIYSEVDKTELHHTTGHQITDSSLILPEGSIDASGQMYNIDNNIYLDMKAEFYPRDNSYCQDKLGVDTIFDGYKFTNTYIKYDSNCNITLGGTYKEKIICDDTNKTEYVFSEGTWSVSN